ncbi:MerR family transcriptional regulator [Sphingomonas abietis]|uniref:Mercuric resistance operon regulatory protein n=1 Tax=Sphingomonas abietis TaxID=3012344 RepID=A0ABY7NU24_9SPHN|nr:MerR family DNA-binding protein [Sphingomonas abietis]WBO24067.1 MerR family DNA-binding protein [Sphingomonas abietis]
MIRSQAMGTVTIGKLARLAGVGVETVRYYQRRGLLALPDRPAAGTGAGIRRYEEEDIGRLRFIRSAQAAGFTLDQIGELLALDAGQDRQAAHRLASARVAELDSKIADMQAARAALVGLVMACENQPDGPCPIIQAFG